MIFRFFQGFFEGMGEAIVPPTVELPPPPLPKPYSRPSKKKMKTHLERALKEKRTQYRTVFFLNGMPYHAIFAYIRSARYTLVFEYVGRKGRFPKLVCFFLGKPSLRHMMDETRYAVADRQQRIDRAFTMERLGEQEAVRLRDKPGRAKKATIITGGAHATREKHAGSNRGEGRSDARRALSYLQLSRFIFQGPGPAGPGPSLPSRPARLPQRNQRAQARRQTTRRAS